MRNKYVSRRNYDEEKIKKNILKRKISVWLVIIILDTDFALYIQLCIKTETLSVYKYVYTCGGYAAVLCKF